MSSSISPKKNWSSHPARYMIPYKPTIQPTEMNRSPRYEVSFSLLQTWDHAQELEQLTTNTVVVIKTVQTPQLFWIMSKTPSRIIIILTINSGIKSRQQVQTMSAINSNQASNCIKKKIMRALFWPAPRMRTTIPSATKHHQQQPTVRPHDKAQMLYLVNHCHSWMGLLIYFLITAH